MVKITSNNHRGDFETCPTCRVKYSYEVWDENAKSLRTQEAFGKHGAAIVVSECPRCNNMSWVHIDFTSIKFEDAYPKGWAARAETERKKRHRNALYTWGASLCCRCSQLEDGHVTTHAWRVCPRGSGPPEVKCKEFAGAH